MSNRNLVNASSKRAVFVGLVKLSDAGYGKLEYNNDVVLSTSDFAAVCFFYAPKRGFGSFDEDAKVAHFVVQYLEHFFWFHRVAKELAGKSYATNAESVSHLKTHRLHKHANIVSTFMCVF